MKMNFTAKLKVVLPVHRLVLLNLISFAGYTALANETWQAQWIQPAEIRLTPGEDEIEKPAANQWFCFRKNFELDASARPARVRIACDSKYWLWVNGKLAVRKGQLKRGPTPTGTYYDRVDLGKHLRPGPNTVAVLLWYFGKPGSSHNSSGQPGLVFDASEIGFGSDDTWRAIAHPAFGETEEPHPNYRLPESNVHFDARVDLPEWTEPEFDDSGWPRVRMAGAPPTAPWGQLSSTELGRLAHKSC